MTDYFIALNEVKQGAVLSPILYCVYVDDLLLILCKAGVGCFIDLHFVGALAYAMTSFFWHLPLLRYANFSLYVKIIYMPANIASPSMHLNPNVWLPNLRVVTTLSKRSMIVFFTSTVG